VTIKNHGVDFNRWEERSGVRWYTLLEEYKPTYTLLLSRQWLHTVKAK